MLDISSVERERRKMHKYVEFNASDAYSIPIELFALFFFSFMMRISPSRWRL